MKGGCSEYGRPEMPQEYSIFEQVSSRPHEQFLNILTPLKQAIFCLHKTAKDMTKSGGYS
jgi:hypothetical protein